MARKAKPTKMGWGEGTIDQRGARFRLRWREEDGRHALSFGSRQEALDELERIQARIALGQPGHQERPARIAPVSGKAIEDLVSDWFEYRVRHGMRNTAEDRTRWALHLAPALESVDLLGVTPRWVRELAMELVDPTPGTKAPDGEPKVAIAGTTAHLVLSLLSAFLQWCVDEDRLTENPARAALRHKDVKKLLRSTFDKDARPRLKSWAEVMKLAGKLEGSVKTVYLLSARAGLRPGETLALTWGDVDLDERTLAVSKQVRSGKLGPTKSGQPRRVPIGEALAEHLAAVKPEGAKDGDLVAPPVRGSGTYLGPKAIRKALRAACKVTSIKPADFYDYGRRTFGTLAALGGVDLATLQAWMGHANITTTMRYISIQQATDKALKALG